MTLDGEPVESRTLFLVWQCHGGNQLRWITRSREIAEELVTRAQVVGGYRKYEISEMRTTESGDEIRFAYEVTLGEFGETLSERVRLAEAFDTEGAKYDRDGTTALSFAGMGDAYRRAEAVLPKHDPAKIVLFTQDDDGLMPHAQGTTKGLIIGETLGICRVLVRIDGELQIVGIPREKIDEQRAEVPK